MKHIQGTDSLAYQPIVKNRQNTEPSNQTTENSLKDLTARIAEKEGKQTQEIDGKKIADSVKKLNEAVNIIQKNLKFQIHEETKKIYVQVVNRENGDIIKQFPPEEILDLEARIQKMVGLILDEKI